MNKKLLSLFTALVLGVSAQASPINGQIGIALSGTVNVDNTTNMVTFSAGPNAIVNQSTGTYAGVTAVGTLATYNSFAYDPLAAPLMVWSTTGTWASFWLTSITTFEETAFGGVSVTGNGISSLAGFDNSVGAWSFSADRSSNTALFNFSSTTVSSSVPDGSTTAVLLGMGLTGLGLVARRRRS